MYTPLARQAQTCSRPNSVVALLVVRRRLCLQVLHIGSGIVSYGTVCYHIAWYSIVWYSIACWLLQLCLFGGMSAGLLPSMLLLRDVTVPVQATPGTPQQSIYLPTYPVAPYLSIHLSVCMYVRTYVCMHACLHVLCVGVHIHVCMYVYVYIYIYIYMCGGLQSSSC